MTSIEVTTFRHALVVGASGGIGHALLAEVSRRNLALRCTAWSRRTPAGALHTDWHHVDITDERTIAAAAAQLDGVDLVVIASGMLHDGAAQPEKTIRALDPSAMAHAFAVNTIGPALVAKHVLPHLPRDRRAIFAALSARVGSISDNRLGGWYSYRASKAALNQIVRTLSVELALKHPQAIAVGLHPGTVDTPLSKPFQGRVPGGTLAEPHAAAARLLDVVLARTPRDTGRVFDSRGQIVPD